MQRSWICLSRKQAMAYRRQRSRDSSPAVFDCRLEIADWGSAAMGRGMLWREMRNEPNLPGGAGKL